MIALCSTSAFAGKFGSSSSSGKYYSPVPAKVPDDIERLLNNSAANRKPADVSSPIHKTMNPRAVTSYCYDKYLEKWQNCSGLDENSLLINEEGWTYIGKTDDNIIYFTENFSYKSNDKAVQLVVGEKFNLELKKYYVVVSKYTCLQNSGSIYFYDTKGELKESQKYTANGNNFTDLFGDILCKTHKSIESKKSE